MAAGSCKELLESASTVLDKEAGWALKARFKAHLLVCKPCRRYFEQLQAICGAAGKVAEEENPGDFDKVKEHLLDKMFSDES